MDPTIPRPRLELLQNGRVVSELALPEDAEVVIGSGLKVDLTVPDEDVSPAHARVFSDGDRVFVEDLDTDTGTYVEDLRIVGPVRMADGQTVRLGTDASASAFLVRFSDPAGRLLREMGLMGPTELTPDPDAEGDDTAGTSDAADAADAAELVATDDGEEPAEGEPGEGDAKEKGPSLVGRATGVARRPVVWGSVLLLLLFVVLTGLVIRMLRPSSTFWRSVQVSTTVIRPGGELTLTSEDIRPVSGLQVFFDDRVVEEVSVQPRRLSMTVPRLGDYGLGRHDITLRVRNHDMEIYQGVVTYVVEPEIRVVVPKEPWVGEEIEIQGSGFVEDPRKVKVRFGKSEGQVVSANATAIRAIVPAVTWQEPARVTLEVSIEGRTARAPTLLTVLPRRVRPLEMIFEATWRAEHRLWEVRSPFGHAFYLSTSPPEGGEPPRSVTRVLERWNELFVRAETDPGLEVVAEAEEDRFTLFATGPSYADPEPLVVWSAADLDQITAVYGVDAWPDILLFWAARSWNDMIQVFGRGEPLDPTNKEPYAPILNALIEFNRESGGLGRPERDDLDRIPVERRQALADAMVPRDLGYGTLRGNWVFVLDDVFFQQDYQIRIHLDMVQRGRRLSGKGRVEAIDATKAFGLGEGTLNGELRSGFPPVVRLRGTFRSPIGDLRLEGRLEDRDLKGTFQAGGSDVSGEWLGVRSANDPKIALPVADKEETGEGFDLLGN